MHGLHVSHYVASTVLMLGLATEADLASLTSICGAVSSSMYIYIYELYTSFYSPRFPYVTKPPLALFGDDETLGGQ